MKFVFSFVLGLLCVDISLCLRDTYRAAYIDTPGRDVDVTSYASMIHQAAKFNVDIIVLPAPEVSSESTVESCFCSVDKYDEIVKSISESTKAAGVYVVAHLFEKTRCQNREELIRSNLVFDREGSVVSIYRKPFTSNCNITTSRPSFRTDFGVTFGVLMEEDLVLQSLDEIKDVKNFVVTGAWAAEIPFLSARQFSSSWAFATNANLASSQGIFAGRSGFKTGSGHVVAAELNRNGGSDSSSLSIKPSALSAFPDEDLSQYIIRPLDVEASAQGYKETVCHRKFCCDFNVKASFIGATPSDVSYGLAVFDGVREFGRHNIGVQTCSVVACAGLYKRSCFVGTENNSTNIMFNHITISGNFTKQDSAQYPVALSLDPTNISFEKTTNLVTVSTENNQNILRIGIFGRVYSKDTVVIETKDGNGLLDLSEYLSSEDLQEWFDYLWIRLRVLLFVVSIYVLEMM